MARTVPMARAVPIALMPLTALMASMVPDLATWAMPTMSTPLMMQEALLSPLTSALLWTYSLPSLPQFPWQRHHPSALTLALLWLYSLPPSAPCPQRELSPSRHQALARPAVLLQLPMVLLLALTGTMVLAAQIVLM